MPPNTAPKTPATIPIAPPINPMNIPKSPPMIPIQIGKVKMAITMRRTDEVFMAVRICLCH